MIWREVWSSLWGSSSSEHHELHKHTIKYTIKGQGFSFLGLPMFWMCVMLMTVSKSKFRNQFNNDSLWKHFKTWHFCSSNSSDNFRSSNISQKLKPSCYCPPRQPAIDSRDHIGIIKLFTTSRKHTDLRWDWRTNRGRVSRQSTWCQTPSAWKHTSDQ